MKRIVRAATVMALALAAATLVSAPAFAQENKRGGTFNPAIGKKLTAANELLMADKPKKARKELKAVLGRRGLKPIEVATAEMLLGYAANAQDKPKQAIDHFSKAIKMRVLPIGQEMGLEYAVAQLYMMNEDFDKALRILRSWFKRALSKDSPVKPSGSNYYTLALCYMQLDNVKKAVKPAELAVQKSAKPQESWLRLLGQIYYLEKEYPKLAKTVEQLIVRWPKPEYYKMLSGAYAESGQELKALAVLQLAYAQGITKSEPEVRHLAQSYLFHEIPYQAAQVLEKGFADGILQPTAKNYGLLGDSWLMARETENAFEPLARAAELKDDADSWMRLAQAYVGREKWEEADGAITKALERNLEEPGPAHLLQGLARMNLRRWSAARASFKRAATFEKQKASADSYATFLENRKMQWEALN